VLTVATFTFVAVDREARRREDERIFLLAVEVEDGECRLIALLVVSVST